MHQSSEQRVWRTPVLAGALMALLLSAACSPSKEPPEDRATRLSSYWQLLRPAGPGPHPAAILLSGCDGVHDHMEFWAREFVAKGRAALILDSHAPRGLDRDEIWRLVCAAQTLRGATRAGDVAVALDVLARTEGIDAGDVVLFGASHGGWTAMEFVGLANTGTEVPGLERWPAPPGELLERVSALVLLYPYCGFLNAATAERWRGAPPALMILAQNDSVVSAPACLARARALRATGATVGTQVIAGADHGFDQSEKSPLSNLKFDAAQRAQARDLAFDFLDQRVPG